MTNASTNSGDAANSLCVSMEDASISFTSVTPVLRAQSQSDAGALLSRTASLCPFVRRVELGMAPVDLTSSQANIVGYRISLRNPVKIFRGLVLEVEQIRIENGSEIHVQAQMGEDLLLQCWTGCPGDMAHVSTEAEGDSNGLEVFKAKRSYWQRLTVFKQINMSYLEQWMDNCPRNATSGDVLTWIWRFSLILDSQEAPQVAIFNVKNAPKCRFFVSIDSNSLQVPSSTVPDSEGGHFESVLAFPPILKIIVGVCISAGVAVVIITLLHFILSE